MLCSHVLGYIRIKGIRFLRKSKKMSNRMNIHVLIERETRCVILMILDNSLKRFFINNIFL